MTDLGHRAALATARLASLTTTTLASLTARAPGCTRLLDHHLLLLVTAGRGSHEVDFEAHRCRPGTVVWARPGQAVRYRPQPGLDAIAVSWPAGFLPALPASPLRPDDALGPVCWQLAGEDEDAVIDEVSQLVVDCGRHGRDPAGTALLRHQLAVLVLRLATATPIDPYPESAGRETFRRFRREVEAGYPRCRQVTEYAERLGCSVRTLTRACLAASGRGAKQIIDDRVALQAKRLLRTTDLPVAEIGRRLGFAEATHFCRLFHRAVGCPPGDFRGGADAVGVTAARPGSRAPADPETPGPDGWPRPARP